MNNNVIKWDKYNGKLRIHALSKYACDRWENTADITGMAFDEGKFMDLILEVEGTLL